VKQLFKGNVTNVKNAVLKEIEKVLKKSQIEWMEMNSNNEESSIVDRQRTKRLLFLFQCDLLPGLSGEILSSKAARESACRVSRAVSRHQKRAAFLAILSANAAMLFYIFLFAVQQTKYRQNAWLQSFLLWLMTEMLFVSTIVVFVVQFVVPSLIMQDIAKLKRKIADLLHDLRVPSSSRHSMMDEKQDSSAAFNAADCLFVSTQLARKLPQLPVSRIILHFRTPWPRQSFQHQQHREGEEEGSRRGGVSSFLVHFGGVLVLFLLNSFVNSSGPVQDGMIHVVAAAGVGYTVLLHTQLFHIFPALAFLPLFCCLVAAHFVAKGSRAASRVLPQSSSSHTSKDDDDDEDDGGKEPKRVEECIISDVSNNSDNSDCFRSSLVSEESGDLYLHLESSFSSGDIDYGIDLSDLSTEGDGPLSS